MALHYKYFWISARSYGYSDITYQLGLTVSFSNPPLSTAKRHFNFEFDLPVKFPHTFIEITGAEPFLLSGLRIETSRMNWLKSFAIEYAKDYSLFPNNLTPLAEFGFEQLVSFFIKLALKKVFHSLCVFQKYNVYYGNSSTSTVTDVIKRNIYFTKPVFTNKFRIVVKESADIISAILKILGQTASDHYSANPNMEPRESFQSKPNKYFFI